MDAEWVGRVDGAGASAMSDRQNRGLDRDERVKQMRDRVREHIVRHPQEDRLDTLGMVAKMLDDEGDAWDIHLREVFPPNEEWPVLTLMQRGVPGDMAAAIGLKFAQAADAAVSVLVEEGVSPGEVGFSRVAFLEGSTMATTQMMDQGLEPEEAAYAAMRRVLAIMTEGIAQVAQRRKRPWWKRLIG